MNANATQMNASRPETDAISDEIIWCGFLEKVYENTLVVELRVAGLAAQQQRGSTITYKGILVGDYFVAYAVLIEL